MTQQQGELGILARVAVQGAADIEYPIHDAIEDHIVSPTVFQRFFAQGRKVFVLTQTHFFIGQVVESDYTGAILKGSSWVGDMGDFETALRTGSLVEYRRTPEDCDECYISPMTVIGAFNWSHELPK